MTYVLVLIFILSLVANLCLVWLFMRQMSEIQLRWDTERQILIDRIQAGSLNEYEHLKRTVKPRISNPLRKGLFPDEIPDADEGGDR